MQWGLGWRCSFPPIAADAQPCVLANTATAACHAGSPSQQARLCPCIAPAVMPNVRSTWSWACFRKLPIALIFPVLQDCPLFARKFPVETPDIVHRTLINKTNGLRIIPYS